MDSSEDGPSGAVKIIRRSGKFMGNNRKPMIIILLSFLLPRYALFYASTTNIGNLWIKLVEIFAMLHTTDSATIPGILLGSFRTFVLTDVVIMLASFLLSSLLALTVVCKVNSGFKGRTMTLKSTMIEIREKLKGVVVTQLYVHFLSLGYTSFSLSLVLAVLLLGDLSAGFYFLAALMAIPFLVLFVYLDFVWKQGVVVSIVEADCVGLTALGKSTALVKGRRALAFRINILLILFVAIVGALNSVANKLVTGEVGFIAVEFIFSGIILFLEVFGLAVQALFYEECRGRPVEEQGMQVKLLYSKVSSTEPLKEDLP